jgi:septal ring factor EnvC (AmiA/AmiB activator)
MHQQQERAIQMAEDKLAHTMAKVGEHMDEVCRLKASLKELKATTTEHQNGMKEGEAVRDKLTKQTKLFKSQRTKMSGLQMELKMF